MRQTMPKEGSQLTLVATSTEINILTYGLLKIAHYTFLKGTSKYKCKKFPVLTMSKFVAIKHNPEIRRKRKIYIEYLGWKRRRENKILPLYWKQPSDALGNFARKLILTLSKTEWEGIQAGESRSTAKNTKRLAWALGESGPGCRLCPAGFTDPWRSCSLHCRF